MEQDADIAAAAPNAAASASGPPRPALAPLPEETELRSVVDGVETTEYAVSPQTVAPSEPSSPTGGRKMSAVPKTPRLSTEAKPVVLKINLSTSRMNLLNDDPSLYASPAAFYEKLKEVANTSELAGLLAQG